MFDLIHVYRERIFFITTLLTAIFFPFSEALVSVFSGALLLQAVVMQSWKHPDVRNRSMLPMLSLVSVFMVYLIWMLACKDFYSGVYELKKVIFWLVIPIAFFISPRLKEKQSYIILLVFVLAVFVSSLISTGKLILFDFSEVFSNRKVSYISHIRFSFQVILAILILGYFLLEKPHNLRYYNYWIAFIILIWLITFLFIAQSLLAIISFAITIFLFLLFYMWYTPVGMKRYVIQTVLFLIFFIPFLYTSKVIYDYFNYENVDPLSLEKYTESGNLYFHDLNDLSRENGSLVFIYVSHDELRREWGKRSNHGYDEQLNGFPLHITLFRYMTSLGLRKDSVGLSRMSDDDIRQVENGLTNYKFKRRFLSLYPRIYETIWELDAYWRSGDPNNKSLAQRIEFLRASFLLVREKPLLGIGTGNATLEYNRTYDLMLSKLDEDKRATSHNQYVNYLVKFGFIGFVWIVFAVVLPLFWMHQKNNSLLLMFLLVILFANFGDSNLETHMGLSFFTFFYSFFLWNSPDRLKDSLTSLKIRRS